MALTVHKELLSALYVYTHTDTHLILIKNTQVSAIVLPVLQMREPRHGELKWLVQGHTAGERHSQDSKASRLSLKSVNLSSLLSCQLNVHFNSQMPSS